MLTKNLLDEHIAVCLEVRRNLGIGPGPWDHEPHRIDFKAYGLNCLALRSYMTWAWCGYVGVPPGHPLFGKDWEEASKLVYAYGGLTYAEKCSNFICHIAEPWEPEELYWLGFDCMHVGDFVPGMMAVYRDCPELSEIGAMRGTYKDISFVQIEIKKLAGQLSYMHPKISIRKKLWSLTEAKKIG